MAASQLLTNGGDEFWQPNWNIDVQKETLHYKTNQDVIASERDLVEPLVRLVPLASLKG